MVNPVLLTKVVHQGPLVSGCKLIVSDTRQKGWRGGVVAEMGLLDGSNVTVPHAVLRHLAEDLRAVVVSLGSQDVDAARL